MARSQSGLRGTDMETPNGYEMDPSSSGFSNSTEAGVVATVERVDLNALGLRGFQTSALRSMRSTFAEQIGQPGFKGRRQNEAPLSKGKKQKAEMIAPR